MLRNLLLVVVLGLALPAAELRVVCSVPELADLVRQVGGDAVAVEALARPGDNPHFISARPSFVRALARADAFVVVGLDLELGWAPALQRGARNRRVQVGQPGYIDCGAAIEPLQVPSGEIDRGAGDVHPHGNPHYLLSPRCGIQVLGYLGERLAALDPERATAFRANAEAAAEALARALYGDAAVEAHAVSKLVSWHGAGSLRERLGTVALGGWMARMAPLAGTAWIDDHSQWPYLADCFDLRIVAHLEPKAGIPPSSAHLQQVIATVRAEQVRGIIAAPWFDPRHARTVAAATDVPLVELAHQAGARGETGSYHALCAHNIEALLAAGTATP